MSSSSSNKLIVRRVNRLTEREIKRVLEIASECHLSKWSKPDYQNEPARAGSFFLVAETENIVEGFLTARIVGLTVPEADLLNLGVSVRRRNCGVGEQLLAGLLRELHLTEVGAVWLEVRVSNENAVRFYSARGFQIIQTRKNFYSNPLENAFVMKLELEKIASEDGERDRVR